MFYYTHILNLLIELLIVLVFKGHY